MSHKKRPEERARGNRSPELKGLPASGRGKPAPQWPLGEPSEAELAYWNELWETAPIAVHWARQRIPTRVIARYVSSFAQWAAGNNDLQASVCRQERNLGLTPEGLLKLNLDVVDDQDTSVPAPIADMSARRDRLLKAVAPD